MKNKVYAIFAALMLMAMTTSCIDDYRRYDRDKKERGGDRYEERRESDRRER